MNVLEKASRQVGTRGFATVFALTVAVGCALTVWFMTPEERNYASVAAVIQTGAICIGLLSLVLIARQTRTTATLSKINSYHQFFGDLITTETRQRLRDLAETCKFTKEMEEQRPLTVESVNLLQKPENRPVMSSYLDEFEEFCGAVHAGAVSEEYAYRLEATRVIRTWVVFEPFIKAIRIKAENERCYREIARLASDWQARRVKESSDEHKSNGMAKHID
jgi:hypothetical protein